MCKRMKVLIVKKKDSCWPFVEEQVNALQSQSVMCDVSMSDVCSKDESLKFVWHLIEGKGMMAYVKDVVKLMRDIRRVKPDVIHAHYGMSGYFTCMVVRLMGFGKKLPIVITYHGSDINNPKVRKLSQNAIRMAAYNIFVSPKLLNLVEAGENSAVIPCGIDWADWPEMSKEEARVAMGLKPDKKYVLFSSDFQTEVKNPELAMRAIENCRLEIGDLELIELTGYARAEVNKLMHAVDVCLMTSRTEGSPQFIKEAMACGCPIVTTRVGDTDYVIGNTDGCYFADDNAVDCAKQLQRALRFAEQHNRTNGRKRIEELGYSNDVVAAKIRDVYFRLVYGV